MRVLVAFLLPPVIGYAGHLYRQPGGLDWGSDTADNLLFSADAPAAGTLSGRQGGISPGCVSTYRLIAAF